MYSWGVFQLLWGLVFILWFLFLIFIFFFEPAFIGEWQVDILYDTIIIPLIGAKENRESRIRAHGETMDFPACVPLEISSNHRTTVAWTLLCAGSTCSLVMTLWQIEKKEEKEKKKKKKATEEQHGPMSDGLATPGVRREGFWKVTRCGRVRIARGDGLGTGD